MTRTTGAVLALVVAIGACTSSGTGAPRSPTSVTSPSAETSTFCRRLLALDERLREVRSWSDDTASVRRYTDAIAVLDVAFRKMREEAAEGVDLAPIEYANGRFGEIVRAMAPDLDGPTARAAVAINLESYNAAIAQTLVAECGPESVEP